MFTFWETELNEGLNFLNYMRNEHSIEPTMKHYALVVDLFCRAGRLDDALSFHPRDAHES